MKFVSKCLSFFQRNPWKQRANMADVCGSCSSQNVGGICEQCSLFTLDGVCEECTLHIPNIMAALLNCASNGHLECLKALAAAGADVNGRAEDDHMYGIYHYWHRELLGYTPLMFAALERDTDIECVKFFIQNGADVNKAHKTGDTPLICAAEGGNSQCMRILIEQGADVNHTNDYGYSALWHAVFKGHPVCTEMLLEAGADVNSKRGCEPMMAAAFSGSAGCMEALIKAGADVNKIGTPCIVGLRMAYHSGDEKHLDLVWKKELDLEVDTLVESTPLVDASRFGHSQCLIPLIKAGADVNIVNIQGQTALNYALIKGRRNFVDELIKAGADVNFVDKFGNTPFILSCHCGVNTAKSLLQAGAKINLVNASGQNALQYRHRFDSRTSPDKTMVLFQYATGETIDCGALEKQRDSGNVAIPDILFEENLKFTVKHLCRMAIRKYLLKLDPHTHLFGRVPRLGLPKSLADYLLYSCTLDTLSEIPDDSADPEH